MAWQMAIVFSVIFFTVRGSLYKKLVDGFDPYVVMLHTNIWSLVFFSGYYVSKNGTLPPIYPEMMLLGIIFTISFGAYLYATKISLSQSVVFSSYSLVITLLLAAILLGEWRLFDPSVASGIKNILGTILAIISLYLLVVSGSKKEQKFEMRWLVFMSINILTSGIGTFFTKTFLIKHLPVETLIPQYMGGLPLQFAINRVKKNNLSIPISKYYLILSCSLMEFFALTFFYEAFRKGPAMLVLPVQTVSSAVFIALCGLLIFKEMHLLKREKLRGLLLGVVGVALLAI